MGLTERIEKKQSGDISSRVIETELDAIHRFVTRTGNVSMAELVSSLKIPEKRVEFWASILEKEGLIKLDYPAIGQPRLKKLHHEGMEKKPQKKGKNLLIFTVLISLTLITLIVLLQRGIINFQ